MLENHYKKKCIKWFLQNDMLVEKDEYDKNLFYIKSGCKQITLHFKNWHELYCKKIIAFLTAEYFFKRM